MWVQRLKSKKVKISLAVVIIVILAVGIFRWRDFYALAESVIDSFTDESMVADTWNATVDTGNGELKQSEKSCEALDWFCDEADVCANTLGDGDYIIVAQADAPETKQWKTDQSNCDRPQCGVDGEQNGDDLQADNTISFTDYPARDYCDSIGGRLPTKDELNCIYIERASFGDNFAAGCYWSSTEYSTTCAWWQYFSSGYQLRSDKTGSHYVRCVRGW